jgi:hypothetical protein
VLTKGEPIAARSGRADDFSWPRGAVNGEPATLESAPDTGAKSATPAQRTSKVGDDAGQTSQEQKPAQRRPRPRLNRDPGAQQPQNFPFFGFFQ